MVLVSAFSDFSWIDEDPVLRLAERRYRVEQNARGVPGDRGAHPFDQTGLQHQARSRSPLPASAGPRGGETPDDGGGQQGEVHGHREDGERPLAAVRLG